MRNLSFRVRVAAVVAAVAVAACVMMGFLGLRITGESVQQVGRAHAVDVAVLLAAELDVMGIDPSRLASDPAALRAVETRLTETLRILNRSADFWTSASIIVPEGDRWRLVARAALDQAKREARSRGDLVMVQPEDPADALGTHAPVSGWYRTHQDRWFGGSAPIAGGAGLVTLAMHNDDLAVFFRDIWHSAGVALGFTMVVSVLLGWWGTGVILGPIELVRAFAARLGRRDYSARVAERGAPEIRRMLGDLNALAQELGHRDARLLERMAGIAETRDPKETGQHVKRVAGVSVEILEGWLARHPTPPDEAAIARETLRAAATLHDLGKVGVSDAVLKKPGKLDPSEHEAMKRHAILGGALLPGTDPFDVAAREVALRHHERWDGKGYPGRFDPALLCSGVERLLHVPMDAPGLVGTEIPLFARMVAIADVFDALSSPRSYKAPWPEERALQVIREESGKAFEPELVEIFLARFDRIRAVWAAHPDDPPVTSSAPAPAP